MTQKAVALLEAGIVTLTLTNEGNGKSVIQDYSDEGTHKYVMQIVMNLNTVKLDFTGASDTNKLKLKHKVNVETGIFSHIITEANTETETPFIKSSVAELNAEANVQDLHIRACR